MLGGAIAPPPKACLKSLEMTAAPKAKLRSKAISIAAAACSGAQRKSIASKPSSSRSDGLASLSSVSAWRQTLPSAPSLREGELAPRRGFGLFRANDRRRRSQCVSAQMCAATTSETWVTDVPRCRVRAGDSLVEVSRTGATQQTMKRCGE
jgi:hypothetical protein